MKKLLLSVTFATSLFTYSNILAQSTPEEFKNENKPTAEVTYEFASYKDNASQSLRDLVSYLTYAGPTEFNNYVSKIQSESKDSSNSLIKEIINYSYGMSADILSTVNPKDNELWAKSKVKRATEYHSLANKLVNAFNIDKSKEEMELKIFQNLKLEEVTDFKTTDSVSLYDIVNKFE